MLQRNDRLETRQTQLVLVLLSVLSVASAMFFVHRNELLLYVDAKSYQMISRRTIDSLTPSAGQIGGVWLPLKQLLTLPLVWIDPLYYSGIAGGIGSMLSFVVAGACIFAIVREISGSTFGATIGAAVFALNPNVLYMQATPMSEMLFYALISVAALGLVRYIKRPEQIHSLVFTAIAIMPACLTRYEAWLIYAGFAAVVGYVGLYQGWDWRRRLDHILVFNFFAGLGPISWMLWNWVIFGSPLRFIKGDYAAPTNWVSTNDYVVGNLRFSLKTFWFATVHNLGLATTVVTILAIGYSIWRYKRQPVSALLIVLAAQFPIFVLMLYIGQRPLRIPEVHNGGFYNVRFALQMVIGKPAGQVVMDCFSQ
ncbi:MAG: hypothetical protein ACR2OU_19320 [Thermomicrobiales bacterium]